MSAVLAGCASPEPVETAGRSSKSYGVPLPELNVKGASDAVAVVKDSDGRLRFTDSKVEIAKAEPKPAALAKEATQAVVVEPAPTAKKELASAATPTSTPKAVSSEQDIEKALRSWIAAWAAKDFAGYMAAYSERFSTPRFATKAQWQEFRKPRVEKPKTISIAVSDLKIEVQAPGRASVTYRQAYKSDIFADNVLKRLEFVLEEGSWRIISER